METKDSTIPNESEGDNSNEETSKLPKERGMPVLGSLFAFAKNRTQFVDELVKKHGSVCKFKLLGHDIVVIHGNENLPAFYNEENITRTHPLNPQIDLLGGGYKNICPYLDGEEHRVRKRFLLHLFERQKIDLWLPIADEIFHETLEDFASKGKLTVHKQLNAILVKLYMRIVAGLDNDTLKNEFKYHLENMDNIANAFDAKAQVHMSNSQYGKGCNSAKELHKLYVHKIQEYQKLYDEGKSIPHCILSVMIQDIHKWTPEDKEKHKNFDINQQAAEAVHMSIALYSVCVAIRIIFMELGQEKNQEILDKLVQVTKKKRRA